MRILGIDPGLGGAFALLDTSLKTLLVFDMPIFEETKGKKSVNAAALYATLSQDNAFVGTDVDMAVIESVSAMPKQGIASAFNFGRGLGRVEAIVLASGIPVAYVPPSKWKRDMKLNGDKEMSRRVATQLFPTHAAKWPLKKHDGRAEAVLLAEWYFRTYGDNKLASAVTE